MDIQKLIEKDIYYPVIHTLNADNSKFRQIISEGLNYWLKIPHEKQIAIDKIGEKIYSSNFCMDDIIDNAKKRNGQPTAHTIYGKGFSICSSILTYTEIFKDTINLQHPDAIEILTDGLINAKIGESLEVYFRECNICPTIEITKKIAALKTSPYLLLYLNLMQLFSENKTNYNEFINNLGLYIQLTNDYATFVQENYHDSNGFLNDVTEGKFTLPIVHAITNQDDSNPKLLFILKQHTEDINIKMSFLESVKKCKSLDFVKKEIDQVKDKLRKQMLLLGGNPILEKYFNLNEDSNVNYI